MRFLPQVCQCRLLPIPDTSSMRNSAPCSLKRASSTRKKHSADSLSAKKIRITILLPLKYNDLAPIEPAKFLSTKNDLVDKFGGCSGLTPTPGTWVDPTDGTQYSDINTGFYVDAENSND